MAGFDKNLYFSFEQFRQWTEKIKEVTLRNMVLSHQKFDFGNKCLIEKIYIKAPFRFSTRFQDEACFIYFSEGNTKINSPIDQIKVSAHDSVLLKCGTYFADLLKYSEAEKYEIVVFHLYPDVLRKIYDNETPVFLKPTDKKPLIQKIVTNEIITKFIESLYFYFDNPQLVNEDLLQLKIKELILLLVQTKNANSVLDLFSDLFTPRNISLKEVVNNHLFSNLSINDLAGLCDLSLSTFNRNFQELFKTSPASYIKTKRLEKAKALLTNSALTISEIAYNTCFVDVAHLSKSFKAIYGISPTEYRKSANRAYKAQ